MGRDDAEVFGSLINENPSPTSISRMNSTIFSYVDRHSTQKKQVESSLVTMKKSGNFTSTSKHEPFHKQDQRKEKLGWNYKDVITTELKLPNNTKHAKNMLGNNTQTSISNQCCPNAVSSKTNNFQSNACCVM